ncbi:DNA-dependent RNA polymerase II second largest subunit, partial [Mycena olivaceomarginata]
MSQEYQTQDPYSYEEPNYGDEEDEYEEITQEDCWTVHLQLLRPKRSRAPAARLFRRVRAKYDAGTCGSAHRARLRYVASIRDQVWPDLPLASYCNEADGTVVPVFPQEARLRNLTYSAPLYIEMKHRVLVGREDPDGMPGDIAWETEHDNNPEDTTKVGIGKVPIMLRSTFCILRGLQDQDLYDLNECPYDSGGYFIINGSEKVLIAQERMATNHVYVFAKAQPSPINFLVEIRSAVEKGGKTISQFQVKMFHRNQERSSGGNVMKATIPYIKVDIPIWVVFRGLGDREVALDFIGNRGGTTTGLSRERRIRYAQEILQKEMLPHVSMAEGSESNKAYFFGYMIHRLLLAALERRELDDRDHFGKKPFPHMFRKLTKDVYRYLQKCVETQKEFNLKMAVKHQTITNGLKYSLATGNWGATRRNPGYTYALHVVSFASVQYSLGREGKIAKPRQLHNTHWGMACGLVKNLALMACIFRRLLFRTGHRVPRGVGPSSLSRRTPHSSTPCTKVFVQRSLDGCSSKDDISPEVSVVRDVRERELRLYTDAGRVCRPLFIVDNQQLVLQKKHVKWLSQGYNDDGDEYKWEQLIKGGVIELLDAEEEEDGYDLDDPRRSRKLAVTADCSPEAGISLNTWTHCEIHPSMILGICASIIPFPDHNQSPRNTYQSAMGKQAMGIFLTNFLIRMDTMANHSLLSAETFGDDTNDSVIMNQSSIDRGLFRSIYYRSYMDLEKKKRYPAARGVRETDTRNTLRMKHGTYDKLEDDGLIAPGTGVAGEDISLGRQRRFLLIARSLAKRTRVHTRRDVSTPLKSTESGIVDQVLITTNSEGQKFVKPFTAEGIVPDIIINPHAIPSRMTIGHLVECYCPRWRTLIGNEGDATPFTDLTVESVKGYQSLRSRDHVSRAHRTQTAGPGLFSDPTYYQRLKHMVDDKIHSRARGPVQILTRQPVEGLRFGEMERDCMISHGIAGFLKERLFEASDAYRLHVCDICGLTAIAISYKKQSFECRACRNKTACSQLYIPYAAKLLFQELQSMNIAARLFHHIYGT